MKIGLILLIAGIVLIGNYIHSQNEIIKIQNQVDNYIERNSEIMNQHRCELRDTGDQIILDCYTNSIGRFKYIKYNETHDKISWWYESSGGHKTSDEFFIPHFEPVNKSKNLKLVKEGSHYKVTGVSD